MAGAGLGKPTVMGRILFRSSLLGLLMVLPFCTPAQGLAVPDAGAILRDIQRALPVPAPKPPPVPQRLQPHAPDDTVFSVKRFELGGIHLVAPVDVQNALKPWLNRDLVFADLQEALRAISALYQDRGWYARAVLPEQDVLDGVVRIDVLEAQLGAITYAHTDHWPVSKEHIEGIFTAQHALGEPLNLAQMNRAISLINELPGVGVKAALAEGQHSQTTDVLISFEPKARFSGSASMDNHGSRSTGITRASLNLSWDNPSQVGDQLQSNLMASQGVRYVRLAYSLPLGYRGWRLGLNTTGMRYDVLDAVGTYGSAFTRGLVLSYPLLRSQHGNSNFSLTLNDASYTNYSQNALYSRKTGRTAIANIGGDSYDTHFGGGTNLWGVSLTGGQVQGSFHKFSVNLARLQRIDEATSLWFSWSGQRALDNLDPSEKMALGGAQGVRAYPGSHGTGDHGSLFTMEARRQLRSDVQALVFYDHGRVVYSQDPVTKPVDLNSNNLRGYSLRGWGLGLNINLDSKTSAKFSWSHRVADNPVPNSSSGANSHNRFWVNVLRFF